MRICNKPKTVTLYVIRFEKMYLNSRTTQWARPTLLKNTSKIMFFLLVLQNNAGCSAPAHQRQCRLAGQPSQDVNVHTKLQLCSDPARPLEIVLSPFSMFFIMDRAH